MLCCTVSANRCLTSCLNSLIYIYQYKGWAVRLTGIDFFSVTWQKGKKPHLFSAALLQSVLHAEWLLLQSQSLGHPYSSKSPARKHTHVFLTLTLTQFFNISGDFNEKIKYLQYFREKRTFTKGTLHIFSHSLYLCSIYLCLSNMEVLIVVVNDRVFRTTGSDETNALFPR